MGPDSINSGCFVIFLQQTHYDNHDIKMTNINMNEVDLLIEINVLDLVH